MLHHVPVKRAFIQETFLFQLFVERGVNLTEAVPKRQEFFFQPAVALQGKPFEEMFQGFFLSGGDEAVVIQLFDGIDVAEQLARVGQVFVYVVKVGQHDFAPPVELVERFGIRYQAGIGGMKLAYGLDVVATGEVRQGVEQFADGAVPWCPYGTVGCGGQLLVHEKPGAFVGEHHSDVAQVRAETADDILCGELDECFHEVCEEIKWLLLPAGCRGCTTGSL